MADRATQTTPKLWRPLVAIAVSYFLIIQSLLAGLAGFPPVANAAGNGSLSFELCRTAGHDAPLPPGDAPDRHSVAHCMLSCAGAHVVVGPLPQSTFVHVSLATTPVWHPAGHWRHIRSARYSIASPRGPPAGA